MTEPVFRANKRRKVFRRRNESVEKDEADAPGRPHEDEESGAERQSIPTIRKPVGKAKGVIFTSSTAMKQQEQEQNGDGEPAIVPMHPDRQQQMDRTNRFVRPTGKVTVTDDKHMYVGSQDVLQT